MENKIKHLEMIQGIINRMASNSFMLKGWAVTLVVGIFALLSQETHKYLLQISYIPVVAFWIMDSYYLMEERLYRNLYNYVRNNSEERLNFSMDVSQIKESKGKGSSTCLFLRALFSKTEFVFYVSLIVVCTILLCVL